MKSRDLRTIRQFVEETPFITEGQLRWWIFHKERYGFETVTMKIGRRVYVDTHKFNQWLESKSDVRNDN